jgi:hypothetical protein
MPRNLSKAQDNTSINTSCVGRYLLLLKHIIYIVEFEIEDMIVGEIEKLLRTALTYIVEITALGVPYTKS